MAQGTQAAAHPKPPRLKVDPELVGNMEGNTKMERADRAAAVAALKKDGSAR